MAANATVQIVVALRDAVTGPLAAIKRSFSGLRGVIGGVLGGGALGVVLKNIVASNVAMGLLAESTRSTVEELSRLKFALTSIGRGNELESIVSQLEGKRADALRGPGGARDAFRILGVDTDELRGSSTVAILRDIADAYSNTGQSADAAAQLQVIFGNKFRELLPLFSQGSQGLDDLARKSDAFGATVSSKSVENARALQVEWSRFTTQVEKGFRAVADFVIPPLRDGLRYINDLMLEFRGFSFSALPEREQLANLEKLVSQAKPGTRFKGLQEDQKAALRSFGATAEDFGNNTFEILGDTEEILKKIRDRLAELDKPPAGSKPQNQFLLGFREQIVETQKALSELKELGKQTAAALQDAFSSNITSAIRAVRTGALSVKEALDSLLDGLLEDIAEFATQELVKRLISAGLSYFGGTGTGGTGGGTNPDIPPIPGGALAGAGLGGGNLLSGGGGGGFKRLGGGGTTINVYGTQTSEEQRAVVKSITRDLLSRNREVRIDVRGAAR